MRTKLLVGALLIAGAGATLFAAVRRNQTESAPAYVSGDVSGLIRPAPVQPAPAYVLGPDDASIVLEEYSDFQCPFCARSYLQAHESIRGFVERRGNVRYAFYDVAGATHFHALDASIAARCAGRQGAYPAAQKLLFERQRDWSTSDSSRVDPLALVADLVGDRAAYQRCTDDQAAVATVMEANLELALAKGVRSTPTLAVIAAGKTTLLRGTVDSSRIAATLP